MPAVTTYTPLNPTAIAAALGGKARGNQIAAPAPGHSRSDRSLSVLIDPYAPEGFIVNGHAGEDALLLREHVRKCAGLPEWKPDRSRSVQPAAHLNLKPAEPSRPFSDYHLTSNGYHVAAIYEYVSADGEIVFEVLRYHHKSRPKTFLQRQPDGKGGWLSGRGDAVLYRLPDLMANQTDPVFVVEGEKDADRLASLGYLATTAPQGSWPADLSALAGRRVYVLADNDAAGEKKAATAVEVLQGIATVSRVDLPGLAEKGDISDWLDAGNTPQQLEALCKEVVPVAANDNRIIGPRVISSAELVRGFIPPDYFIDGVAQKGFIYSMTAATGTGKTAVLLLISALTSEGGELSGREVAKGRVVYFAGENPDDVTMRWIGMAHETGFNLDASSVFFIKDRFSVPDAIAAIAEQVEEIGGADLVIVDMSTAE